MNIIEYIVFEELVLSKGRFTHGRLREKLEIYGFVDSDGWLIDSHRLNRLVQLAEAPPEEQSTVLQLPAGNPLRLFYENVLQSQNQDGLRFLELIKTHQSQQKKIKRSYPRRTTPEPGEGVGLGSIIFDYFLTNDFSDGCLGRPAHHAQPERIVWVVESDLGVGFETCMNETERRKYDAYRILVANKPDAHEQVLRLGIAASSIPAMQAWLSRTGCPPPLMQGLFQLHIGKSKLRANLFCPAKTNMLTTFTSRFREVAKQLALNLEIKGPREGMAVEVTFSAARTWVISDPSLSANRDEAIKFTALTWGEIKNVLAVLAQRKP